MRRHIEQFLELILLMLRITRLRPYHYWLVAPMIWLIRLRTMSKWAMPPLGSLARCASQKNRSANLNPSLVCIGRGDNIPKAPLNLKEVSLAVSPSSFSYPLGHGKAQNLYYIHLSEVLIITTEIRIFEVYLLAEEPPFCYSFVGWSRTALRMLCYSS